MVIQSFNLLSKAFIILVDEHFYVRTFNICSTTISRSEQCLTIIVALLFYLSTETSLGACVFSISIYGWNRWGNAFSFENYDGIYFCRNYLLPETSPTLGMTSKYTGTLERGNSNQMAQVPLVNIYNDDRNHHSITNYSGD